MGGWPRGRCGRGDGSSCVASLTVLLRVRRRWRRAGVEPFLAVCGGVTDTMQAATTQLTFGPPGSQIDTGGFDHPAHGDAQRLWNVGYAMTPPNKLFPDQPGTPTSSS